MGTAVDLVRQALYERVESDPTFFNYYGLTTEQAAAIAEERADVYIAEAIVMLKRKCVPDVDLTIDTQTDAFVGTLNDEEILLIGGDLAFEVYMGREIAKMKTRINTFTSSDLKALHSPANERNSFMEMFKELHNENLNKIADYASRDRSTGAPVTVNADGVGADDA